MISREEAREHIKKHIITSLYKTKDGKQFIFDDTAYFMIDKIYDSIGSCSECKHGRKPNGGLHREDFIWCSNERELVARSDSFYCSDFDRK